MDVGPTAASHTLHCRVCNAGVKIYFKIRTTEKCNFNVIKISLLFIKLTGISDGFDLVHIMLIDDAIEGCVHMIQQFYNLKGGTGTTKTSEPNDITEEYGAGVVLGSHDWVALLQIFCHTLRQHS